MILKQNYKRYIGFVLYVAFALLCAAIVLSGLSCGSVKNSPPPVHRTADGDTPEFLEVLNDYRAERLAYDKKIDTKETEIRRYFRLIDKLEGQINGIRGEIDVINTKARTRLAELGFSHDLVYTLIDLVGNRRYEKAEIIGKEEYLERETMPRNKMSKAIPQLEILENDITEGVRHE